MSAAPPDPLDRKTSRTICDAVAERLQRDLRPDSLPSSSRIAHLLNTMRSQELSNAANTPVAR